MKAKKITAEQRRRYHIRKRVFGTSERPRMSVKRSLTHVYVQIIDDENEKTLLGLSTTTKDFTAKHGSYAGNIAGSTALGSMVAEAAKAKNISKVVFDRNGNKYHGRVKALADAARAGGLDF